MSEITMEMAMRDDVLSKMVPSDVRILISRAEKTEDRANKYKEAFKWLDAYWATDPDMPLPKICPVCNGAHDDWDYWRCRDNAWDLYEKERAEAEL